MVFDGHTRKAAAEATGVHPNTVEEWAKAAGLKGGRRVSPEYRKLLCQWYREGYSPAELARLCNLSPSAVARQLDKGGVRPLKRKRHTTHDFGADVRAEALAAMLGGEKPSSVAKRLGCCVETLSRWRGGEQVAVWRAGGGKPDARERVRAALTQYDKTQKQIAAELGVSRKAVGNWQHKLMRGQF